MSTELNEGASATCHSLSFIRQICCRQSDVIALSLVKLVSNQVIIDSVPHGVHKSHVGDNAEVFDDHLFDILP